MQENAPNVLCFRYVPSSCEYVTPKYLTAFLQRHGQINKDVHITELKLWPVEAEDAGFASVGARIAIKYGGNATKKEPNWIFFKLSPPYHCSFSTTKLTAFCMNC